ncbi:MAG: FHIPEP family type III secretion protein [Pirellulales bacterium]
MPTCNRCCTCCSARGCRFGSWVRSSRRRRLRWPHQRPGAAHRVRPPSHLTDDLRAYRDADGRLHVVTLDPALEDRIRSGIEHTERGLFVRMSPQAVEQVCDQIAVEIDRLRTQSRPPVVLVSPQLRAGLKQLTEQRLPNLVVLSYNEVTRDTAIESHGMISDAARRQVADGRRITSPYLPHLTLRDTPSPHTTCNRRQASSLSLAPS